jgi:DNA-directed RNA polymerase specialized sigma24 family protein
MTGNDRWKRVLYTTIGSCLPIALRITRSIDDAEDVGHDVYIALEERISAGLLCVDKGTSKPFVATCVRNKSYDRVRGYRVKDESLKRCFQRCVSDSIFEETAEGWDEFVVWYTNAKADASPKRPISLDEDVAEQGERSASRLVASLFADCVEAHNPNSILALRIRQGKTVSEVIEIEKARKARDAANADHDPLGYGLSDREVRNMLRREINWWRSGKFDLIYDYILTRVDSLDRPGLIEQLEDLYEVDRFESKHAN